MHFSFIGKAQFRRAAQFSDSSYEQTISHFTEDEIRKDSLRSSAVEDEVYNFLSTL